MNELLLRSITLAREQTLRMADQVKDADLLKTTPWAKYHPAWMLGHIDMLDQYAMQTLEPVKSVALSRSTGSNIYGETLGAPFMYRNKAYYTQRLSERLNAFAKVLTTASAETLNKPVTVAELKTEFKTIGDVFAYIPYHEALHHQQFINWFAAMEYHYEYVPMFKP